MTDRRPHRRGGSAVCPDGGSRDAAPSNQSRRFLIEDIWRGRRTAAGLGWAGLVGGGIGVGGGTAASGQAEPGESEQEGGQFLLLVSSHQSQIHADPAGQLANQPEWRQWWWWWRCVEMAAQGRFCQGTKASFVFAAKKKEKEKKGGILTSCVLGSNYY